MPLHEKDKVRGELLDDVYASDDLSVVMPKYKFPKNEHAPRHAYQVVHDELMLDGNSRQNLATFCQTWAEPEVHKDIARFFREQGLHHEEVLMVSPELAETLDEAAITARSRELAAEVWKRFEALSV